MSEYSKIEWTDHTFNPWEGCQKIGPGCDHCYAETRNARFAGGTAVNWGPGAPRRKTSSSNWNKPLIWNKNADAFMAEHGRRQRVFCASLADVFDNAVNPTWRADLFGLIMKTPHLDWLLLTKRIGNVTAMLSELAHSSDPDLSLLDMMPLPNVWIGATIVNQEEADRDIPKILNVPARVRFLSMEPLLGPVDLSQIAIGGHGHHEFDPVVTANALRRRETYPPLPQIDWVIVGGESGPGARPMSIQWARELRDQTASADVPFLFKQWGEWAPSRSHPSAQVGKFAFGDYKDDRTRFVLTDFYPRAFTSFGASCIMEHVGKKAAGRQLDGRTWTEFPKT